MEHRCEPQEEELTPEEGPPRSASAANTEEHATSMKPASLSPCGCTWMTPSCLGSSLSGLGVCLLWGGGVPLAWNVSGCCLSLA